uniref:Uncharacterized protein n=1 Tax=Caenorhabditis japonica TaxID=281687 RepID=A0A8R1EMI0_CAEJA
MHWGNCTEEFPSDIDSNLPYSSGNCLALCKAKYFFDTCGCSPALYNIENRLKECTPFETYTCIDTKLSKHNKETGKLEFQAPVCTECAQQCNSLVFRAYNSANFQMINVFYRDMSYTEYNQVQDASITQLLSDIGGNMGMFLGMSVITITEICLFFSKVFWIGFSKKRRDYMYSKKINEKTHAEEIDETVARMKVIGSDDNLK